MALVQFLTLRGHSTVFNSDSTYNLPKVHETNSPNVFWLASSVLLGKDIDSLKYFLSMATKHALPKDLEVKYRSQANEQFIVL